MALPDKPLEIDLAYVDLDTWVLMEDMQQQAEKPSIRQLRTFLIGALAPAGWTAAEVGKLNLDEMQIVMRAFTAQKEAALPNASSSS
jgi:hypothetical protein